MVDASRLRILNWEGCLNARDLGGYATADGRVTRWGAVVRSDHLTPLTESGRAAVVAYGVETIVDLRRPDELDEHPNPFAGANRHGISYSNVPFEDPLGGPPSEPVTLADQYREMLVSFRPRVGTVMTTLARASGGGVLIHCRGGQDRTGLISALLLDLVAVPREIIGEDYALTAECLRPMTDEWLANGPGERADRELFHAKYTPMAEIIIDVLNDVDQRHGGTETYLLQAGMSAGDVPRLRDRLIAPLNAKAPSI
ncbi:MAG: tyrosine-protein phosphatase [Thermomicrobiales bacterium]